MDRLIPTIELQGHRGERALLSENSIPGFIAAYNQGVDTLEMDLAVSKEGILVVSHDPKINFKICKDADGKSILQDRAPFLHDLSLKEIQSFDCGSIVHPRFPTQITTSTADKKTRIPTLDEVFDTIKELEKKSPRKRPITFNIETKSFRDIDKDDYPLSPSEFAKKWLDAVKKYGLLKRAILQSFDPRTLVAVKAVDKSVVTAWLSEDPQEDLVASVKSYGADILSPQWDMPNLNSGAVTQLHKMKVKVIPWTANDEKAWQKLIDLKVDGIISDNPVALHQFLHSKGISTLTEQAEKN